MNGNRIMLGFLLIALGVVFLLHQTGNLEFSIGEIISTYWPVIIIYFSLTGILFQKKVHDGWSGSYIWNLFGLAVGLYFLGRNLGFIDLNIRELMPYAIPAALIIFGVGMIFKPKGSGRHSSSVHEWEKTHQSLAADPLASSFEGDEADYSKSSSHSSWDHSKEHTWWDHSGQSQTQTGWFSDVHIGQTSWELKPMNVSHFIGDTIIDLTTAYVPIGETRINISSFIGDVKIFVPNDPDLELHIVCSSFIGDSTVFDKHESGFLKSFQSKSSHYEDGMKRIRINVSSFIGDLRVQRVS